MRAFLLEPKLKSASIGGDPTRIVVYNYQRQRTRKTVSGVTTIYHYDEADRLILETDTSGQTKRVYIYLNDTPIAQIDKNGGTETITYLHTDHLNTPRWGTDSSGAVVWQWNGEACGLTAPTGSVIMNLRFPGQYYDAESNLHHNWNRYFDPKICRYVTPDPIGLAGGMNLYGYANQNPLRFTDPMGLQTLSKFDRVGSGNITGSAGGGSFGGSGTGGGGSIAGIGGIIGGIIAGPKGPAFTLPGNIESRARGKSDPISDLEPVKVGRDCEGNCNPCPPDFGWTVEGDGHGQTGGYTHWIRWNQDKSDPDCTCYPDRPSRGLGK